ncbi:MAG TPA: DNA-3-methyladenine glycosylase [Vicinamibacteria bacterium]|jgi:DNA-3-methyladenine glycosylase II|nr:DNA-3-methyladenine glycosylase [Vicinamibacteria bacterium]
MASEWPAGREEATLDLDPKLLRRAAAHLRRRDPVLARIIAEVGPCRLRVERGGGPFSALVESIVYQQITGRAAATIHGRLCALAGGRRPRPEDIARASDAALRKAGLSRQKIGYLRDLTSRAREGLPLGRISRLPDEAVIEALTAVKGIGRWTAEMFLIFRLGRLDVLPVDDYGIRKAMQKAYRKRALPKADWMRRQAEPWAPYRTVASWYLWRSLDGPGGD